MAKTRLRLSLTARLLLCFALGGVVVNLALWYSLIRDRQPRLPQLEGAFPPELQGVRPDGLPGAPAGGPPRPPPGDGEHTIEAMVNYSMEIFAELARDGSFEKGKSLAQTTGIGIRKTSPGDSWTTDEKLPHFEEVERVALPFPPLPAFLVGPGSVAKEQGGARWLLVFPQGWHQGLIYDPRFHWLLAGQVSVVILLCFLFALWQMRPLRTLKKATLEVARGNFEGEIPVEQESELGDLARAFNQMTAQIRAMMDSKDELIAGISHELRSPLTRIELALAVGGDDSAIRISKNVKLMNRLIAELLEASRLDSRHPGLKLERFQMKEVLADLAEAYAGQNPGLVIENECHSVSLVADPEKIRRVFVNLIENALKYSVGSGGPIVVACSQTADTVTWFVRDSGPGVPDEALEKIFEPFFRVDRSRNQKTGGYGLGLNLCRKIAVAHGGSIAARNLPGAGLEIAFTVPLQAKA